MIYFDFIPSDAIIGDLMGIEIHNSHVFCIVVSVIVIIIQKYDTFVNDQIMVHMIKIKDISKEVLQECRRIRPNEFKDVSRRDVEMIMTIIWTNIIYILKAGSLLAVKDVLLFRPNLKKKIIRMKARLRNMPFKPLNDEPPQPQ
jgi:hypothetical protein